MFVAFGLALASAGARTAHSQSPGAATGDNLEQQVEAAMAEAVPNGSAAFMGDGGRVRAHYQSTIPRNAASTIKLPLVLEVLRQEGAGALDLSTPYTVRVQDVVGGTGVLQSQVGKTVTLRDLARLALVYSDNVAANVLIDRVGFDQVNATMQTLGFANTRIERHMMDTAAEANGQENWTTADDLAGMLQSVNDHSLLSAGIDDQIFAWLRERGDRDLDWLGLGLPDGTLLSHINGTLLDVRNDAGIIVPAQGSPYVLAVCEDKLVDADLAEHDIAKLSRRVNALVQAWARAAVD